jgi:hypothetical protein
LLDRRDSAGTPLYSRAAPEIFWDDGIGAGGENLHMENLLYEMLLFSFLGVLYYFYQKRKILSFEANKGPIIMDHILQSCLAVRGDDPDPNLDPVIESLDDFLQNKTFTPPTTLLQEYAQSSACTSELREVILQGIEDLSDGKK